MEKTNGAMLVSKSCGSTHKSAATNYSTRVWLQNYSHSLYLESHVETRGSGADSPRSLSSFKASLSLTSIHTRTQSFADTTVSIYVHTYVYASLNLSLLGFCGSKEICCLRFRFDNIDKISSLMAMNQSDKRQPQLAAVGVVNGNGQMAYAPPYQTAPVVATGTPAVAISSPNQPPTTFPPQQQLAYHQTQQFHSQQQQQQLQAFWANQMQEIEQTSDFKNHSLPLARIKKIMKADEDVRMISAEAPVIFAKACEMFILELTMRSWIHTEENKRRTLQKNDIAAAISRTDVFDFLVDIIPRDELKEEGLGITKATIPLIGSTDAVPYYYVPPHHPPLDQAALYAGQHTRPPLPFMAWPQVPTQQQPPQQQPSDP